MIGGDVEFVAVALARLDGNVRRVRVRRPDGIEHVHLDVEAVQVQIGGVEIVREVGVVDDHLGRVRHGLLVVLVLDLLAGFLEHPPVVVDGHFGGTQLAVGLVIVGLVGREVVPELDPEGLAGTDAEGRSHESVMILGFRGVGSAAVHVVPRQVPAGFGGLHRHGPDRRRQLVVDVAAGAGIRAGDEVGRRSSGGGCGGRCNDGHGGGRCDESEKEPMLMEASGSSSAAARRHRYSSSHLF